MTRESHFAADQSAVRDFVLRAVIENRRNIAKDIQDNFGVSRGTAHNYLRALLAQKLIARTGRGQYELAHDKTFLPHLVQGLEEHEVWAKEIYPHLSDLPQNVLEIWQYGCTEMINNVIDHSGSKTVGITIDRTPLTTEIAVYDVGVGIFRKIKRALGLEDDRHAVLELSKGKVTTDPQNHTGEGIFFSSRAFDDFRIISGGVFFHHNRVDDEDWILGDEQPPAAVEGTGVIMRLSNTTERTMSEVWDAYATDTEEYRFDRTVVPVKLLEYGDERLVSRSQGKRLMNRFDRFRTVVLDFEDVESIGQAFADEVFRVFPSRHPEVEVMAINANEQVTRMMKRALSGVEPQRELFKDA